MRPRAEVVRPPDVLLDGPSHGKRAASGLLAVLLAVGCATAPPPPALPLSQLAPPHTTHRFPSGLTVLAFPRPGDPIVGLAAFVTTGGRTESADDAGALHVIEHLVFRGGSPRFPATQFRKRMSSLGDEIGGWTWDDEIQFGFEVPATRFPEALDVFAEALMEVRWDSKALDEERQVVLQEIGTSEDNPWTRLWNAFDGKMFRRHPYGRAVIGDRQTVAAFTAEGLAAYHRDRFAPNHLVVAVAGAVDDGLVESIAARFARYSKGPTSVELPGVLDDGPASGEVRIEAVGETCRAILGARTPGARSGESAALTVLGALLASPTEGLPPLLFRESGWVVDFGADHNAMVDYGQLTVRLELPLDRAQTVLDAVNSWLDGVAERGFSREAVDAAARRLVTDAARASERRGDLAMNAGMVVARAGAQGPRLAARLLAVTPDEVRAVARRWLKDRVTALALPKGRSLGKFGRLPEPVAPEPPPDAERVLAPEGPPWTVGPEEISGSTHRFVFDNGLTLLVREQPGASLVAAVAYVSGGQWLEEPGHAGIGVLTNRVLTTGTARLAVREWDGVLSSRAIEVQSQVAGDDRSQVARNSHARDGATLAFSGTSADTGLMLSLLGEALFRPVFPAVEVAKAREGLLSEIRALEDDDLERTKQGFYALAYPNHPYGRPTIGLKATVERLSQDDVAAHHRRTYAPDRTVVAVVGAVRAGEVARELARRWGGTPVATLGPLPSCDAPVARPELERDATESRGRPIACVNLGGPVLAGGDPRWPALELLLTMTRGQHFYKYVYELGVSYRSWVRYWPHRGPSPWIVENDLDKRRFAELVSELEADVANYARSRFGDADLALARDRLLIQATLDAQKTRESAFELAWGTSIGRPWDATERLPASFGAVTPDEVNKLAREVFGAPVRYRLLTL